MAHRTFTDAVGRLWEAWEVYPTMAERRKATVAVAVERRRVAQPRASLPEALRGGWLAFQSGQERRRLAPPPDEWEALSDAALAGLLAEAEPTSRHRRLIE